MKPKKAKHGEAKALRAATAAAAAAAAASSRSRMGLGVYLKEPETFPSSRVIFHTADFVAIHDLYPKATVHALLLPRRRDRNLLHPFEALADDAFRRQVIEQTARLKRMVAGELRRLVGRDSRADAARQAVLDGEAGPEHPSLLLPPPRLPEGGRDWEAEVMAGVHAVPSMSHLHVHVLSRDMHSNAVRHRRHYNSFNTPFFVPLGDIPLAPDDGRRHTGHEGYLRWGMRCWRCGRDFGNRFKELKEHLDGEFVEWKRE
ncbi:aprataxin [Geosmithia morbida]|uniref:Aprataxin n=1 Tax=Geosmithia morbida TaxID=1094350 RepID=A0A9P4YPD7_9HYPO|nr:aprataxin [Geosmithia morbida]KAF4119605.1 aprataxin [Geosmithia morbida]